MYSTREGFSGFRYGDLADELERIGVEQEIVLSSVVPHAFTVFGLDIYREDAYKKSWTRFNGFLHDPLGK